MATYKSSVWPGLLISLGVFFLILNYFAFQISLDFLKYWPAILIYFGCEWILRALFFIEHE